MLKSCWYFCLTLLRKTYAFSKLSARFHKMVFAGSVPAQRTSVRAHSTRDGSCSCLWQRSDQLARLEGKECSDCSHQLRRGSSVRQVLHAQTCTFCRKTRNMAINMVDFVCCCGIERRRRRRRRKGCTSSASAVMVATTNKWRLDLSCCRNSHLFWRKDGQDPQSDAAIMGRSDDSERPR